MRLFDADRRADSITGTASGVRCTTQASSFSRCSRSGTLPVITTASIPNCLKQSASKERAGSLMSTRATRAEAFLLRGGGARTSPDDFCMSLRNAVKLHSGLPSGAWQRDRRPICRYQGAITQNGLKAPIWALQTENFAGVTDRREEDMGASVHARAGPGKPRGFVPAALHSFARLRLRRLSGIQLTAEV